MRKLALLPLALLAGCTALLGREDLTFDPADAGAADSSTDAVADAKGMSTEDGPASDAGSASDASFATDAGQDAAITDSGSADACVTVVFAATADTYVDDLAADCNASTSHGKATTLRVKNATPLEAALVRFALDGPRAAALRGSTATAALTIRGAACTGTCLGNVHPMRSDWDEGTGGSDGADYCRARSFSSAGWGNGTTGTAISTPADYGAAVGTMSVSGSDWSSPQIAPQLVASYITDAGALSFFVDMSSTGEIIGAARELDGGAVAPTMAVRSCP